MIFLYYGAKPSLPLLHWRRKGKGKKEGELNVTIVSKLDTTAALRLTGSLGGSQIATRMQEAGNPFEAHYIPVLLYQLLVQPGIQF